MNNFCRVLFSACILAMTCACAGRSLPDTMAPTSVGDFTEGYIIEPGNRVRLTVFNETTLSGEFAIDNSGNLALPLIGVIPASGVSAKVLSSRVEEVLKRANYMRDPKVSVEIASYRPFYVLGEVRQPGEFPYTMGMTVLSAVARAGGYDYRAWEGEVILIRIVNGTQKEMRANERTPIMPGDIIRVIERVL